MELDLDRFKELGVDNKVFTEIHSKKKYVWTKSINLNKNSSIILTNR